jgi:hypothetical protein
MANDKNGGSFIVGQVHHGFFGEHIALSKHVQFDVHRQNGGLIYASLTFNRLMTFR